MVYRKPKVLINIFFRDLTNLVRLAKNIFRLLHFYQISSTRKNKTVENTHIIKQLIYQFARILSCMKTKKPRDRHNWMLISLRHNGLKHVNRYDIFVALWFKILILYVFIKGQTQKNWNSSSLLYMFLFIHNLQNLKFLSVF